MAESDQIKVNFWDGDSLDRKSAANYLEKYLTARYKAKKGEEGFVLAINAEWGFGKTFMLQRWQQELAFKDYPVVYFDAWKNDFTPEPLVAFISELDDGLEPFFKRVPKGKTAFRNAIKSLKLVLKPAAKAVGFAIAKQVLGVGAGQAVALVNEATGKDTDDTHDHASSKIDFISVKKSLEKAVEKALKEHKTTKKAIEEFKNKLNSLIDTLAKESNVELPLFIFVDELDRCRPDYAIELLEGIKHLFGVKGIYFVIATNISQLSHSVKAIYGNDFDGARYLKRFFDLEYTLPMPNSLDFVKQLIYQLNLPNANQLVTGLNGQVPDLKHEDLLPYIFVQYSEYFDCGLRDQIQVIKTVDAALISLLNEKPNLPIQIHLLLFLAMLYQRSAQVFNAVVEKNKVSEMTDKISELRINDTKGIFSTSSYLRVGSQQEYSQKKTSVTTIAHAFFNARGKSTFEEFDTESMSATEFPAMLIRSLLQYQDDTERPWKNRIDKYIDAVRYAGGFN